MYRWVLFVICLMLVFGCACAPSGTPMLESSTSMPIAAPTAAPTETPEAMVTATPTIVPTATASSKPTIKKIDSTPMIVKGKDKERVEVNRRFEDFLNGKGEYTNEKLKGSGFTTYYGNNVDLGCISLYDENVFAIQGVILYYKQVDEGEIFAFGTKNKDGRRIIALIEFPSTSFIKNEGRIQFLVYSEPSLFSKPTSKYFLQKDGAYYDFLKSCISKISSFSIYTCIGSEFVTPDLLSDGFKKIFAESIDPKIDINSSFMTNVNFVDDKDHHFVNSYESTKRFSETAEEPIITVNNFDNFDEFLKSGDYSRIPSNLDICFIDEG